MSEKIKLTNYEMEMLAGEHGIPRRWAMEQQMQVARFFDAVDFVEVSQAHIMCDTESLSEAGIEQLEYLASQPERDKRVAIPTVTDPRGLDMSIYQKLNQPETFAEREQRAVRALRAMGILMTDTCINYQTISPPVFGQHLAFGDTGPVIYANSVFGAHTNFEGGPAALAAAFTGRVPRYGCHLPENRMATQIFHIEHCLGTLSDWGALGAIISKKAGSYWSVPAITGIEKSLVSDELNHFGAALASLGSVPLYHMEGVTAEALDIRNVLAPAQIDHTTINVLDIRDFYTSFQRFEKVDIMVFAAPQLSLFEIQHIAGILDGRKIIYSTALLIATSPEIKSACDRFGITAKLEDSGAIILNGVCFYQMYARELREANGWNRLVSNSAKLVNIVAGYGYEVVLATTEQCVEAANHGKALMGANHIYECHPGIGRKVSGIAIAASDDFSTRYDLDRMRGVFSRSSHGLYGESFVGKILVLNTANGGVASAWMLLVMVSRKMAPTALVLNVANPIMAQGAVLVGLTLVDRFNVDITNELATGDFATIDPQAGLVIRDRGNSS